MRKFVFALIMSVLPFAAKAQEDTLRFIYIADTHVESDFMEAGKPRYPHYKVGNHASLERTFRFINEDPFCSKASFILMGGDNINTGYAREQESLDAEMVNFRRLVGVLDLYNNKDDLDSFRFEAPETYICAENLAPGQQPMTFRSPAFTSRLIPIQGNHDTDVQDFYRNCAFQCKGTRFVCFFASYCFLPSPPGGYRSTGYISDETYEFVRDQVERASADPSVSRTVLVCHWAISTDYEKFKNPIIDACEANGWNDNRSKILALAEKHNIRLYINGHEHVRDYPVAKVGNMYDVNCGPMVWGKWSVVEITSDKAIFHVYSRAEAVPGKDGAVEFTSLPKRERTFEIPLDEPAVKPEARVVLRLLEAEVPQLRKAAETLVKADIPFAIERVPQEGDSPEMQSLLAYIKWKNNLLTEKLELPAGVSVVDVRPGEEEPVIERIAAEGWKVRLPGVWNRIIDEEKRQYSYRKYYVSASGDDSADGLSSASAWRTLDRVNRAELGFGDQVLFRRGEVFRGHLEPKSGKKGDEIVYGAYGKGEKPILEPSYDASSPQSWEQVEPGLWRCIQPSSDELGNIVLDHGASGCAWKVDRRDQIVKDLHYCWVREENAVYIKSQVNPGERFSSIELAEKQHVISQTECHDVIYDGLWLRYGSAHGIGGSDVKRIVIRDCDISWIGGSTLYFDDEGRGVRYGNGIEFWSAASDILVENCRIWECWDAGITNQSNVDGVVQKNIIYRNNEIWNCEYSYEYWQQGEGARTENIVFEKNFCRNAGGGWGHVQRWNPNAGHLMFYDTTADTKGFVVRCNTFSRTEDCCIRLFNAWYPSLSVHDNVWDIPEGILCLYHGRPTSSLKYKFPDHLDRMHRDDHKEMQSEAIEKPCVLKGRKALGKMKALFNFD